MEKHPSWIQEEKNVTKLEQFMVNYINHTVTKLGPFPLSWIVVDEAIYDGEGGTFNTNPWSSIDDYVCKAFKAAN